MPGMRILFDQGTPVPLKQYLPGHQIETAFERGWARLSNGELIAAAEKDFDVLVTTDKNLRHQQSLSARKLAVLVLPTTSWPRLRAHMEQIVATLAQIKPGEFLEVQIRGQG
jgi:predicted nuclease of predicted toxin-antitoxin system